MMNIDVPEEQLLIFCWLSCVIPLVDLIYIPWLFLRYNLLVDEVIVKLSDWRKNPSKFKMFSVENGRRKEENNF